MQVTDLLKIKTINAITLTKDGSRAAFTVTAIEPDGASKSDYKYSTQLYTLADGAPRQLTYAKESAAQPAWNPAGTRLAFVRAVDGKTQLFVMSMQGGEAVQLTKFKYAVSNPSWSPDGKKILFSVAMPLSDLLKDSIYNPAQVLPAWPSERPGFSKNEQFKANAAKPDANGNIAGIRAYLEQNETDKKAKVLTKLNFQNETDVSADQTFNQFFSIRDTPNAEPVLLTKGFNRYSNAEFTPDGKHLIVSGDVDSLENPDRSLENEIFIADADGSNLRLLLGEKGKSYTGAAVSPSGKWLAFLVGTTSFVSIPQLAVMPLTGSPAAVTFIPFDRTKSNLRWSRDEKKPLLHSAEQRRHAALPGECGNKKSGTAYRTDIWYTGI